MSIDLKGYTALITGGSSGMGFEMARELSAHGATVVIAARPGARLENACCRLRGAGGMYMLSQWMSETRTLSQERPNGSGSALTAWICW